MHSIVQHFCDTCKRLPGKTAIKYKKKSQWHQMSWRQYHKEVEQLAWVLKQKGLGKGDRLALLCDTRWEWAMVDLACLALGAVLVPIYASSSSEDIEFILNDSAAKFLVCENLALYRKYQKIAGGCSELLECFCIDSIDGCQSLQDLVDTAEEPDSFLEDEASELQLEDLATIVYTSGTTGTPKGVMLSHLQIVSEIEDAFAVFHVTPEDRSLSFLPFSHIFGRCEHWGHVYAGFEMAFAENIESLRDNLLEIRPSFLVAVPRIFEKIYNGVIAAAEASPLKHRLFLWAVDVGKKVSWHKQYKQAIPTRLLVEYKLADKLVFSKLAQKLGGRVRFAVSGGAPLQAEIAEFFHAAGLLVLEGYGLTETCAAVSLNTHFDYKFGSVGLPLGDAVFRVDEDGEILVKSKKLMLGYYKRPDANAEVFTEDGYFRTGDVGKIDEQGFLYITDRKKDLIKTAGGKYVAPQKLEKLVKASKYISNVLIHGDRKKYIVALITLESEQIIKYAEKQKIPFHNFSELVDRNEIYQLIRSHIAELNQDLASYETIKAFDILDHDFTIEGGQLTPSLKVKRKHCDRLYETRLEKLYGNEASWDVRY